MKSCICNLFLDGNCHRSNIFNYPFSMNDVFQWYYSLGLQPAYILSKSSFQNHFPFSLESIDGTAHRIAFNFLVSCPICNNGKLEVKTTQNVDGYVCPHCNAVFDARQHPCSNPAYMIYYGLHRSDEHIKRLNSNDYISNLLKSMDLECNGLPLHDGMSIFYITKE